MSEPTQIEEMIRRAREEARAEGVREGLELGRIQQLADVQARHATMLETHDKRLTAVERMPIFVAGAIALVQAIPLMRGLTGG